MRPVLRRLARWAGGLVCAALALGLVAIIGIAAYGGASRPTGSIGDFVAESNLLVTGAGGLVTIVLAVTTIYYAYQARQTVLEGRAARTDALRQQRALAVLAMTGAVAELITVAEAAGALRTRRRLRHTNQLLYPCMLALAATSRSLDGIRLLGDPELLHRAETLFDRAVSFYGIAVEGAPRSALHAPLQALEAARAELIDTVAPVAVSR